MDTKEKSKRGKAIIGIAMAAVMVVALVAMVPMASARPNPKEIDAGDTVYIGEQGLKFDTDGIGGYGAAADLDFTLEGVKDTVTEAESPISVDAQGWTVPSVIAGKYVVKMPTGDVAGGLNDGDIIYIAKAEIKGDVILNTAVQDSVVGKSVPTSAEIVFKVEPNIGTKIPGALVDIKVYDPDGVELTTIDGQPLNDVAILGTTMFVAGDVPGGPVATVPTLTAPAYADALDLDQEDAAPAPPLDAGTYKVKFKTDKGTCNMLDVSSPEYTFTIRSEELKIEAVADEVGKGTDMSVVVNGNPKTYYYVTVTGVDVSAPPAIKAAGDVKDRDRSVVGYDGIPDTADDNGPDGLPNTADDVGPDGIANNADDWLGPDGIADTGDDLPELRPDGAAYAGPDGTVNTEDDIPCLAAWIQTGSDGIAEVKIDTTGADDRTYTIKVYDTAWILNPDQVGGPTYDTDAMVDTNTAEADEDSVDIKVEEAKVIFDMPKSAIIGSDVTIKGAVSAGKYVDIVIEDANIPGTAQSFNDVAVDENKEFEEKWDTSGLTTGSYTIDVYIDRAVALNTEVPLGANGVLDPSDYEGIDEDGSTAIRLVEPGLTAKQLRNVVAEDDDYEIEGTATGVDDVDIVLVGPDGYPPEGPGLDVANGLEITSTSVTDDEFSEDITMGGAGFDTGVWMAMVLSPGRDGKYGDLKDATGGDVGAGNLANGFGIAATQVDLRGKNQKQIIEMLKDHTIDVAGSDDFIETFTFKVESASVTLNPIASVGVGEPLIVSGTTNREPETLITISTFAGPVDLPAEIVEVEWPTPDEGVFNATIDTSVAVPGTYTIEADDGDGNTDTVTVEITAAVPTPTPVVSPTPTPTPVVSPTPPPEVTPTPTPPVETPTPTPPGFEAVFAIAGLLAIAYLVLRRRR